MSEKETAQKKADAKTASSEAAAVKPAAVKSAPAKTAKKPLYQEAWFGICVAVVLILAAFGAGVGVGVNIGKSDATEVADAGNDSDTDATKDENTKDDNSENNSQDEKDNNKTDNSSGSSSSSGGSSSGSSSSNNQNNTSTSGEYKIGDTVSFQGYDVKVTKVDRNYRAPYNYAKLGAGNEFIRVWVEIKNISNSDGNYTPLDWFLELPDGKQVADVIEASSFDSNYLDVGDLAIGAKRSGIMVFEVPEGETNLKMIYQPIFTYDGDVAISLKK